MTDEDRKAALPQQPSAPANRVSTPRMLTQEEIASLRREAKATADYYRKAFRKKKPDQTA